MTSARCRTAGFLAACGTWLAILLPLSTPAEESRRLTLTDCLALARENNPVVSQAQERIRELVADHEAARSSAFPRLALTSYYQRLDPDRLPPGGFIPSGQQLFVEEGLVSLSAKQIVFRGGRTYCGARAAALGAEAQREELVRAADEIAYMVTEAFFRLLEAKENLRVAEEARQQRQAFAAVAEAFFRAGKVTRLDSLRARSLVADAEQAELEAGNAITLGRVILASAVGLRDEAAVDVLDVRGELPQELPPGPDIGSLWRVALRANPEIKKLDSSLAQSQSLIKAARGGYFPEVSLLGAVGLRHQDVAGTRGEWLIGAFLDFPIFEGGLTSAQVAKASSQRRQLLELKRARLDGLRADLAAAWRDQENARRGAAAARQTVATNAEAYASAEALYRAGKAIALDVLQAQAELTASRFSLVRYQVSYALAQARIRQIVHAAGADPSTAMPTGSQAE